MNELPANSLSPITLSELAGNVSSVIAQAFQQRTFWVIADVANHSYKPLANHHYFDLVEKDKHTATLITKIPSRAWSEGSFFITKFETATGQRFSNDLQVLVQVSVFYNPLYGLQLTLLDIDTNFTLGALEQQKRETLSRLVRDNAAYIKLVNDAYITYNQGLKLPVVIQNIAVISSRSSAGLEDFMHNLQTNDHGYKFTVDPYYSAVQGELNAQSLVDQLIDIYNSGTKYDAIFMIRGGGSQTDLLLFDQYAIGRAIARFPIPVITGIGHQKNETIADMMAHSALKTPTKAAEYIVAHNKAFSDRLLSLEKTIIIRSQQFMFNQSRQLESIKQKVTSSATRYVNLKQQRLLSSSSALVRKPIMIIHEKKRNVEEKQADMKRGAAYNLKNQSQNLENFVTLFRLMSPVNVLRKGFALVRQNGAILSNGDKVELGNKIEIILADKEIGATVIEKQEYDGKEFNL